MHQFLWIFKIIILLMEIKFPWNI